MSPKNNQNPSDSHPLDDGGESVLSGYDREHPTEPEAMEALGDHAASLGRSTTSVGAEIGDVMEPMEPTEQMIDEAIEESFPASDPPSYIGSTGECVHPRC